MIKIAHRGASGTEPENTIAAFKRALDMHVDGIELDVHLTADGEILVIHDDTLDRTTTATGPVNQMTLEQIRSFEYQNGKPLPTLTEVLNLIDRRCMVNIELKGADTAVPVVNLIEWFVNQKDWHPDIFLVSSFDWTALQQVRKINPNIPIGVLTATDIELAIGFATFIKAETIHPYFHLLNPENVAEMKKKGLDIFTWTVNEHSDIEKMKALGVDGIITDFPDRI